MKTKRSTTHGSTRKNKRIMSGGKGKISSYTRRFKDHFKRYDNIDDNNKIKKCESWGSLHGIFKFVQAQKETYKDGEGNELSGLEKMIGNIEAATNSSNTDRYIKAIDCFKQGGDTILSGTECVSYDEFVNGGGDAVVDDAVAPVVAPVVVEEGEEPVSVPDAAAPVAAEEQGSNDEEPVSVPDATDATAATAGEIKAIGGGGRSRRHTRPVRRIKSRKSKKGRMTRRKHRSSGRR